MAEHAVIVHMPIAPGTSDADELFALEDRVEKAIAAARAGEFDGNEFGGGEYVMYMYGPDAERLFAAVRPIRVAAKPGPGSYAVLRWGAADDPRARQEKRPLE